MSLHRSVDPKVVLLQRLPSLAAVCPRDLASVAPLVDDLHVPAGTVLVAEGDLCHEVVLVLSGTATLIAAGRSLGTVGAGDVVGDVAVRKQLPHDTTVTATTDLHVLVAGPESYRAFVRHPLVVRHVTSTLSDRLRRADAGVLGSELPPPPRA